MSLYDEAAVALIAEGAAGKDGKLYNIKPEEKLKATELLANGGFDSTDDWALDAGGQVSIADGKLVFTNAVGNTYKRAKSSATVFEDGKKYKISFTVTDFVRSSTSIKLKVQEDDNKNIIDVEGNGNFSAIYEGQATEEIQFKVSSSTTDTLSCKVDNVSVKEVEQAPLDFTFTRDSNLTATRVAPSGYIEKGRENLLLQSNQFDTTWTKTLVTVSSGQSGFDGSSNAWLVTKTSTGSARLNQTSTAEGVFTYSCYAKAGTLDGVILRADSGSGNAEVQFDLTGDGSVYLENSNCIDSSITKIGSGWFRCSLTSERTLTTVRIYPATETGSLTSTGTIYIQNAQLEAGLVATEYIESHGTTGKAGILEDSPRFDYLDVTCPHLLMEPTRKNLVPYSEYFGAWTAGNVTVTDNDVKSPEGVVNAAKLLASDDTTAVNHQVDSGDFSIVSGAVTGSVFAKKGNVDFVRLRLNGTTAQTRAWFDLENGTVETVDATDSDAFGTIVDMGDGWYKCSVTEPNNAVTSSAAELQIFINESDGQTSWIGDGDEYIYVYGAQYEQGAYATSYIPNHGKSGGETRNEDYTSTIDVSEYMDGKDFTFFVDLADNPSLIRDGASTGIRFSNKNHNYGAFRLYRTQQDQSRRTMIYWADRDNDTVPNSHQIDNAGRTKVIVRRVASTGEFTVFYDGDQQYQRFNTDFDDFKNLIIHGEKQPIFLNSLLIFDRALTDDECDSLTTV